MAVSAQTFTERLQKKIKNQGTVTVHQDAAIDELVNGTGAKAKSYTPSTAGRNTGNAVKTGTKEAAKPVQDKNQPDSKASRDAEKRETAKENTESTHSSTTEPPIVDTRKKVMRNSYKVNGYRVQAFAGGNTRRDRQKAEQASNDIKANFSGEPVYVHFYSPRWICRVGNYRSYEEAHQMLLSIRKLGYKQAFIVKGKITIQY